MAFLSTSSCPALSSSLCSLLAAGCPKRRWCHWSSVVLRRQGFCRKESVMNGSRDFSHSKKGCPNLRMTGIVLWRAMSVSVRLL